MSSAVVTGAGSALPGDARPGRRLGGLLRPALRGRAGRPADLRRRRRAAAGTRSPARCDEDLSGWGTGARMERYVQEALPLGKQAVAGALDAAGLAPGDVGLFAVATCTGYATPGLDIRLASDLGMPAGLQRLLVGHMGCYAALPGLAAVGDFVTARSRPAVLLCCELTSLHVQPAQRRPRAGGGARAVLRRRGRRRASSRAPAAGRRLAGIVARTDPSTADHMTWDVTDLGFRMGLSPRVPDVLARHVGGVVDELLDRRRAAGRGRRRLGGAPRRPADPRRRPGRAGAGRGAAGGVPAGARRARQLLVGDGAAGAAGAGRRRRPGRRDGVRARA